MSDHQLAYRVVLPPDGYGREARKYAEEAMYHNLGEKLLKELQIDQWYTVRLRKLYEEGYEFGRIVSSFTAHIDLNKSREERIIIFKYEDLSMRDLSYTAWEEMRKRLRRWLQTRWPRTLEVLRSLDPT